MGTDSAGVVAGKGVFWTSSRIPSNANLVRYKGKNLSPSTRYFWKVTTWSNVSAKPQTSAIASFETGMVHASNWVGKWVIDTEDIALKPAPYFRKTFHCSRKIKSARVYITVAGLYVHQAGWRARPTLCLNLRIQYTDGSIETIATGDDWKTASGSLVFNSIYTGEHYDARLEQAEWNSISFNDVGWKNATAVKAPSGKLPPHQ